VKQGAAAALLLLLAGGCSGDDPTVEAAPGSTTTTSTTVTTTSTTVPATTTTVPEGPCGVPGYGEIGDDLQPAGSGSTSADIDGDAVADTVSQFTSSGSWRLIVSLAAGGGDGVDLPVPAGSVPELGPVVDVDGDGSGEVFSLVGQGAATETYALFDLDRCDLEPVVLGEAPAELVVGGTVLQQRGLACGASDLTVLTATSVDGITYETVETTYELERGSLVAAGQESATRPADDPALAGYAEFAC
jgi:hypothetical protein